MFFRGYEQFMELFVRVVAPGAAAPRKCDHPDCELDATGCEINGGWPCINHIDWAMERAFAPVRTLAEALRETGE